MKQEIKETNKPIKCICGNCGKTAWIIPIPKPNGSCLCGNCTFGDEHLSLADMMKIIFCKEENNA